MKIKYKVLKPGMKSPYQKFKYKSGQTYHCDNFDTDRATACSTGFYATDIEGLPYTFQPDKCVWECEVSGREVKYDIYKWRFENIKLIRKLTKSEIIEKARTAEKECGYLLSEVLFPINPLKIKPRKVTQKQVDLLKEWATFRTMIRDAIGVTVWDMVKATVGVEWITAGAAVEGTVWDVIRVPIWGTGWNTSWDTVLNVVGDTVWAYISSLFPNIKKWKYIDHKFGVNPFQPGIDLWRSGFIVSYKGEKWRLHTGPKAEIVYTLPASHDQGKEEEDGGSNCL